MDIEELKLTVVLTDNASAQLGAIRSALQDISGGTNQQNMSRLQNDARELGRRLKELVKHLGEGQKAFISFVRNAGIAGVAIVAIGEGAKKAAESLNKFSEELLNVAQAARIVGTSAGQFKTNVEAFERAGLGQQGSIRAAQALQDAFVEFNRQPGNQVRQDLAANIPAEQIPLLEEALKEMRGAQSGEEWFNIVKAYGERVFKYWDAKGDPQTGARERRRVYEAIRMDPRAREVEDLVKATDDFIKEEEERTKIAEEYFGAKTALQQVIADALRVLNTETMEQLIGPVTALADAMEHLAHIVERSDFNWFDILGAIPGLQIVKPLTNLPKWEPPAGEGGGGKPAHLMSGTGSWLAPGEEAHDPGRPQKRSEFLKDTPARDPGLTEDRRGEPGVAADEQRSRARLLHENTFELKRLTDFLLGSTIGAPLGIAGSGTGSGGGALAGAVAARLGGLAPGLGVGGARVGPAPPMGRLPSFPRGGGGDEYPTPGGTPAPGRGPRRGPGGAPAPGPGPGPGGTPPGGSPAPGRQPPPPGRGPGASLGPQGGPAVMPGAAGIFPHGRFIPGRAGPAGTYAATAGVGAIPANASADTISALNEVGSRHGIDPQAIAGMIRTESEWKQSSTSPGGTYRGLTQIGQQTFREAGGRLAGMTWEEFLRASPGDQIRAYGAWLDHYQFQDKIRRAGVDFSRMSPSQQAAYLQGFQFAPNAMGWQYAAGRGEFGVPTTTRPQARVLGDKTLRTMGEYYRGFIPGQGSPVSSANLDVLKVKPGDPGDISQQLGGLTKMPQSADPAITQYPGSEGYFRGTGATRNQEPYQAIIAHVTGYQNIRDQARFQRGGMGYAFVIDKDGSIYQFGDPAATRSNQIQGPGSRLRSSQFDLSNKNVLGIGFITGGGQPTEAQLSAADKLVPWAQRTFGIDPTRLYGHGEIQGNDPERRHLGPGGTPEGQVIAQPLREGLRPMLASTPITSLKTHPTETAPFDKDILDFAMAQDLRKSTGTADVHVKVKADNDEEKGKSPPYKDTGTAKQQPKRAEKADAGTKTEPPTAESHDPDTDS